MQRLSARAILEAPIVDVDGEPVPPIVTPPGVAASGQTQLFPYQADVLERFRATVAAGRRRVLLVAPTGAGKTVLAASVIAEAVSAGRRVLFLAHRRELIQQASVRLHRQGIDHGIVQAGWPPRPGEPVQVASIQTLWARAVRSAAMELPPADVLIIDEAHHTPARTYRKVIASYPNAVLVGLTATPCRGDGRGLGSAFDVLLEAAAAGELVRLGYLVPTRCYAPSTPDLRGVKVRAGDYIEAQLANRMDNAKLVGDVVSHWHRLAEARRTVVFATGVRHSLHLRDEFRASGVVAEHLDGATPTEERDAILARLARGEVRVVVNCMVLTEGWDQPDVSCVVLARPTKHMGLYRQMIGRVLRRSPGKADAIVLDHAGAIYEHGFAEDPVAWTLRTDRRADNPAHRARQSGGTHSRLVECVKCSALRVGGDRCRSCGYRPEPKPRVLEVADGELSRVGRDRQARPVDHLPQERERWHAQLISLARERGYKPGWAAFKYREKFGRFPPWAAAPQPIPASAEVRAWVRSRIIAFAKARAKAPKGA
jgi:superfamily II DNA or RNA helicase